MIPSATADATTVNNNTAALQAAMAAYGNGINNNNNNSNGNISVAATATATNFHPSHQLDFNGVAAQIFNNQFLNANNPYNGASAAAAMIRGNDVNLTSSTSSVGNNSTSSSLSDATNSFTQQLPKIIHHVCALFFFIF